VVLKKSGAFCARRGAGRTSSIAWADGGGAVVHRLRSGAEAGRLTENRVGPCQQPDSRRSPSVGFSISSTSSTAASWRLAWRQGYVLASALIMCAWLCPGESSS
jgi:hypothetical protein